MSTLADSFSGQELDRLRMAFDMHAVETSMGCNVPTKSLKNVLKSLFIVPTSSEFARLFSTMDPESTGKIDFPSFFSAMAAILKPQYGKDLLNRAFGEISGGLDTIDKTSLLRVMKRLGQTHIRLEDCEAMIREVDREGNGVISKADFLLEMWKTTV